MVKQRLPYDDLVSSIRTLVAEARVAASSRISDDSDQWWVANLGYSPMERQTESVHASFQSAEALGARLLAIGEPAAAAVAKGLRSTGSWREYLLPFAAQYRALPVIREALELVARRQRDPLTRQLAELEAKAGATSRRVRRPRRS